MEISTPYFSHITKYPQVYEPAEDTFLLLDALEADQDFLRKRRPLFVLEVGVGSGVVTSFLYNILGNSAFYFCTDRNPEAAECTQETMIKNKTLANVVQTDLVGSLQNRLKGQVDLLVFNPPYVVTPNHEIDSSNIASSWAGGSRGRVVMNRFFPQISSLLSNKGIFYLVVIKENDPSEIICLFETYGFDGCCVISRQAGPEFLSILKFTRKVK